MGMVSTMLMLRNLEHCIDTVTSVMFFLNYVSYNGRVVTKLQLEHKVKLSAVCHPSFPKFPFIYGVFNKQLL